MISKLLISIVTFTMLIIQPAATQQQNLYNETTKSIVNPNQVYTYQILTEDIKKLSQTYPNIIEYKSLGKTVYNRELWAVKLGKGKSTIFINASHHAREWITTNLVMSMIDQYAQGYISGKTIGEYNIKEVLDKTSIWFVPMVNPDGVTLQQEGLQAFPKEAHNMLLKYNEGSYDFKRWKANAEGIDLNLQYPAGWDEINKSKPHPLYFNFKGSAPLVTNETKSLVNFTYEIDPEISVSYHSSGRILYWHYYNKKEYLERDLRLATIFANLTGYELIKPTPNTSGGGYKDWFIQEFKRPGFTPEIGYYVKDINPPLTIVPDEWERNKKIGLFLADEGYKLWQKR